jgi:hypothetical protein
MNILKFMASYADEALSIGKALTGLLDGVAINSSSADNIKATITKLEAAHDNLMKYIKTAPKETVIKISKSDIDAAVNAELKKILPALIDKAVKENLANK